jgi:hypothetical protein
LSGCVLFHVIFGNNITILTIEKLGNLPLLMKSEAKVRRYYYLDGGPLWTVPELLFEIKGLIQALQQLLASI